MLWPQLTCMQTKWWHTVKYYAYARFDYISRPTEMSMVFVATAKTSKLKQTNNRQDILKSKLKARQKTVLWLEHRLRKLSALPPKSTATYWLIFSNLVLMYIHGRLYSTGGKLERIWKKQAFMACCEVYPTLWLEGLTEITWNCNTWCAEVTKGLFTTHSFTEKYLEYYYKEVILESIKHNSRYQHYMTHLRYFQCYYYYYYYYICLHLHVFIC